jgi:serine/threonine protein phosphatase PrpC
MPVIVLCDGVSSARHSQRAAGVAAQAAWARLAGWLTSRSRSAVEAMREAIGAASRAIISLDDLPHLAVEGDAPSSTIVAAVVADQQLTIGWVGDSRAYWCGRDDAQLLTRDHSWAVEAVAAGQLGQRPLPTDPMAHALTRWLGSGATDEPTVINLSVPSDGTLVVCSDGLWNYLPEAEQIAALVRSGLVAGRDAGGIAQRLVAQALTAGGKDNITVGVAVL